MLNIQTCHNILFGLDESKKGKKIKIKIVKNIV